MKRLIAAVVFLLASGAVNAQWFFDREPEVTHCHEWGDRIRAEVKDTMRAELAESGIAPKESLLVLMNQEFPIEIEAEMGERYEEAAGYSMNCWATVSGYAMLRDSSGMVSNEFDEDKGLNPMIEVQYIVVVYDSITKPNEMLILGSELLY